MPTVILYAVEIADMERWVGSRDAGLLHEAKALLREDDEADWEDEELAVLDRLLERMVMRGELYEGLGDEESYYEVEVTLDDGSQVDVQLDERFEVVGTEQDGTDDD